MSLEQALAENTLAIKELVAAMKITGENQERLIAGQAAAIAKVDEGKAPATRRKRGSEAEPAATAHEAVVAEPVSEKPAPSAGVKHPSHDELKAIATDFLSKSKPGSDAKPSVDELAERGHEFAEAHKVIARYYVRQSKLDALRSILSTQKALVGL